MALLGRDDGHANLEAYRDGAKGVRQDHDTETNFVDQGTKGTCKILAAQHKFDCVECDIDPRRGHHWAKTREAGMRVDATESKRYIHKAHCPYDGHPTKLSGEGSSKKKARRRTR
jgi:hypothetical protein